MKGELKCFATSYVETDERAVVCGLYVRTKPCTYCPVRQAREKRRRMQQRKEAVR